MKAAQLVKFGGVDCVRVADVNQPVIERDQVLVQVHAAAVNPFDYKVREGAVDGLKLPATLGGDVAGVIRAIGEDVHDLQVGQAVFGQANVMGGQGSWAEFAPVKAASLAPKPEALSFTEAAAAPLVTVSAYQALVETLQLQPDQQILIHGGAGGIGTVAIQ